MIKYNGRGRKKMRKGWPEITLDEVCQFKGGNGFKEHLQGKKTGLHPFIKVSDLTLDGNEKFITSANNWIDESDIKEMGVNLMPPNSVVFAKVGAALKLNKRRILTIPTAIDNNMMAAIPDIRRIDTEYLYYFMLTQDLGRFCQESAVPSINQQHMAEILIPLPPLAEQRKIAAILRTWDDAIEQYDLLIKKCKRRRDAIAIRIYGEIQRQASLSPMNKVCEFIRNGIVYQPAAEGDRKFQVTRIETISFGIIDFARTGFAQEGTKHIDRYKLEAGDILFSHINSIDHIGKTAIFEGGDLYHGMNLLCFRANRSIVRPRYLYNFLMLRSVRNYFMRKARPAVAQVSLNISDINECQIPVPSLDVQNDIVAKLGCFDLKISFLKKSRELTIKQKRGLMQKLLTGEKKIQQSY